MTEKFVVKVAAPAEEEAEVAAQQLASILNLDLHRVTSLVNRLPDIVTKPINHREASVVVERFSQAGLNARLIPAAEAATVPTPKLPVAPPEPMEAPADGTVFEDEPPAAAQPDPDTTDPAPADRQAASLPDVPPLDQIPVPDSQPVEPVDAAGDFRDISPADLQARLKRRQEAAGGPAAASESVGTPAQTAVLETEPTPTMIRSVEAPVAAKGRERSRSKRTRRRATLQSKLVWLAVLPVLLTIVGALAATWFTARPALYQQLLDSARNPAIATAASLSSAFERTEGVETEGGIDYLQLQSTILITRQAFPREDIAFIIATDTAGDPLPGFFAGADSLGVGMVELQTAIRDRALEAISLGSDSRAVRQEQGGQLLASGNTQVEIVAQPLIVNEVPVGAIVVGVTDTAVTAQVNRILLNILLFSLVPLFLAILIASLRARRLTGNVLALTNKADEISRGNLDDQIGIRSNDELEDLAAALERMRISMRGAMDRLRRRRS